MMKAHIGILGVLALCVVLAGQGGAAPARATSPPSIQMVAIDTDTTFIPANTDTSVGSIEWRRSIPVGGTMTFDLVAVGIPAENPLKGYSYTLSFPTGLTVTAYQPRLITTAPGSSPSVTTDPLPDTDGSFNVVVDDTGPLGSAESGDGVLDTMTVESFGPAGLYLFGAGSFSHIDPDLASHTPDTVLEGAAGVGVSGGTAVDLQLLSQTVASPPVLAGSINSTVTVNSTYINNGLAGLYAGGNVTTTFTLPTGCTADGASGNPFFSDPVGELGVGISVQHQRSFTLNCVQPTASQYSVKSCIVDGPGQVDIISANNCETDVISFLMDSDGDGWTDVDEAGMPLCGDSRNEDSIIAGGAADDAIVDDGCPGGPAQDGTYSEAQFNIGTGPNDACRTDGFPPDFVSGGVPTSTDKVTLTDLTSFLAPMRRYGTSPGDAAFNQRWDLVPGRGFFNQWINISDFTKVISIAPPMAPFNGTRAFGGPACS